MSVFDERAGQARLVAANEAWELTAASTLNAKVFIDGNQWCVMWGENLQDGIAGFGDTPLDAILAFNRALKATLKPSAMGDQTNG